MTMARSIIALVLAATFVAHSAPNVHLIQAKRQVEELDFEAAAKTLEAAAAVQGNDRATVLEILELQAVAWATLGRADRARGAFRALLALDPAHSLPGNQPPRVRTPFYEAKDWVLSRGPLALVADATREGSMIATLSVQIKADALSLARAVVFHVQEPSPVDTRVKVDKTGVVRLKVELPRVKWSAEVLGERDAVLASVEPRENVGPRPAELAPEPVAKVVQPTTEPAEPRASPALVPSPASAPPAASSEVAKEDGSGALRKTGLGLMAAGAVALVAGSVVGYQVTDAQSTLDSAARNGAGVITSLTQRQAQALDTKARSSAVLANEILGAGVVLAGAGMALWMISAPATPVAISLGPGSIGLSGRF